MNPDPKRFDNVLTFTKFIRFLTLLETINLLRVLVTPAGLDPATYPLGGNRS